MNINHFCKEVAFLEGKEKSQSIAQIKETLKCIRSLLQGYSGVDIYEVIRKAGK